MATQVVHCKDFGSRFPRVQTYEEFLEWGRRMGIEPPKVQPKKVDPDDDFETWLKEK